MKIQIIHDRLARGGIERQIVELLKRLKKHPDIEVELVFFSDEVKYPEIYDFGYTIHLLRRKFKIDLSVLRNYYKLCAAFKPDVIHSWGNLSAVYAIFPHEILGIPFINQYIMNAPEGLNLLDKRYFKAKLSFPFSNVIIGNSEAGLKKYNTPKSKGKCIYSGIDVDRGKNSMIDTNAIRIKLGLSDGPIVGMVGAFHDRKDFDTFIQSGVILLNEGVNVNFLAIGDGANLRHCKALVPESYSHRILLPGQMDNIESVIAGFDIGVLASNSDVHGEGISNSIMEYMLFEKPVVATDGGGTPEIVKDGENGFLVPPKSPQVLAEKIKYLLNNPQRAREMGIAGKLLVEGSFSLQKMEHEYLDLYQKLISEGKKTSLPA